MLSRMSQDMGHNLRTTYSDDYTDESELGHSDLQYKCIPFVSILFQRSSLLALPTSSWKTGMFSAWWVLTFLFARNTFKPLHPWLTHTRPHKSVLSTLNYSISDYLITLHAQASMFLTSTQEVTGRRGCFSNAIIFSQHLQGSTCLQMFILH